MPTAALPPADGGADGDDLDGVAVCPFPKLSFAAINCNSLNMSNVGKEIHTRKIYGIVKLKADIIFASDIRLCNRSGYADKKSLETTLAVNPYCSYKMLYNSSKNSRGVAIFYKTSLPFTEERRVECEDENFLLVLASIRNTTVILGAIYGPNLPDLDFLQDLRLLLSI
jgi:hypothetical protein